MHAIVTNMPGFISVKMFTAEDGEVLALAELIRSTPSSLERAPEHIVAQQRGREEFFAEYRAQICSSIARPPSRRRPSDHTQQGAGNPEDSPSEAASNTLLFQGMLAEEPKLALAYACFPC